MNDDLTLVFNIAFPNLVDANIENAAFVDCLVDSTAGFVTLISVASFEDNCFGFIRNVAVADVNEIPKSFPSIAKRF